MEFRDQAMKILVSLNNAKVQELTNLITALTARVEALENA